MKILKQKKCITAMFLVLVMTFSLIIMAQRVMAEEKITELLSFSFNNEASDGSLFSVNDSSEIEWITEADAGKDGDTALKVTHIDGMSYTSADNAVRLTLETPLPAGGIYNISAWFYAPSEENEEKNALTGPGIVLNQDYPGNAYKLPGNAGSTRLPVDEWFEINVNTPLMEETIWCIDFRLVTNEAASHADVWYLGSISINQVGELEEVDIPEWDLTLASIADTYKDSFLIGNVMEPHQISDKEIVDMYKHHYNAVTAENVMKPQNISPEKGVYNYKNSDTLIDWAEENGITVHGHTLIWHSQSAAWLAADSDGNILTRAEARDNMEDYIKNVAGHFKGRLDSWDVVNEALDGGSEVTSDWRSVLRKEAPMYMAYENGADKSKGEGGADYIYDAFVFARLADPDAVLYYNDYNETDAWKRQAMALMTEELNEKWEKDERNTEPGRLLIEGLGMQAHYWMDNLNISAVDATIKRFAETGAKISVTELDIPFGSYSSPRKTPLSEADEILQARMYAQLFEVYMKYADNIERITFWGKTDPQSWRMEGSPLLFNKLHSAKQAYYGIIDPKNYLTSSWKNPYTDVSADDWFYEDIIFAESNKLMSGIGANTFFPDTNVTIGDLITILYQWDGQSGPIPNFWAIENGLVQDDFDYYQMLNRQELAVIIQNYLTYTDTLLPADDIQYTYADDADIDKEAKPAVELLYKTGILSAKEGDLFEPYSHVSRAETAAVLHRLITAIQAVS